MPFLKFSRDKRGYENFFLMDAPASREAGKGRPRLLFWFRTPPNVKVGREAFSADVRRMVEEQNPGIVFDWDRIMSTPIPSADVDRWRERRRAEKAARRAVRGAEAGQSADDVVEEADVVEETGQVAVAEEATGDRADTEAVVEAIGIAESAVDAIPSEGEPKASDLQTQGSGTLGHPRRRRRRRRRRGQGHGQPPNAAPTTPGEQPPIQVVETEADPLTDSEPSSDNEV